MAAANPLPHFSQHAAFPAPDAGPADADADADFAVFRLLLPPSFSDADTMRLYAAVNPLRRRTAALQVRVEPLDPASVGGRIVASVLGPTAPVRRVEASSSSAEPLALSPAQEALVAVIDAEGALYCDKEEGARRRGPPGCFTCLLLVDADRLEAAAGRGVLERISLEAGADVRVALWEECAPLPRGQPPEEVVEVYQPFHLPTILSLCLCLCMLLFIYFTIVIVHCALQTLLFLSFFERCADYGYIST